MTEPLKSHELLKPGELKHSAHARYLYSVIVGNDVPLARILMPGFWANHWQAFQGMPFGRVEVVSEDGMLDVDLRCVRAEPGLVYMRPLRVFDQTDRRGSAGTSKKAPGPKLIVPEGYKVRNAPRGPKPGWFVQLNSTGNKVGEGIATEAEAIKFAQEHNAKSTAAVA